MTRKGAKMDIGKRNTEMSVTYSDTKSLGLFAAIRKNGDKLEKN